VNTTIVVDVAAARKKTGKIHVQIGMAQHSDDEHRSDARFRKWSARSSAGMGVHSFSEFTSGPTLLLRS
jgi:hypothetical protein